MRVITDGSHFEIERDEPPIEGEILRPFSMVYRIARVLPAEGNFDGVVEAEWLAGPGQTSYTE